MQNQNFHLYQGDSHLFRIDIQADGKFIPDIPVTYIMTAKTEQGDSLSLSLSRTATGLTVYFPSALTSSALWRRAAYDLRLIAGGEVRTIMRGSIYLTASVTDLPPADAIGSDSTVTVDITNAGISIRQVADSEEVKNIQEQIKTIDKKLSEMVLQKGEQGERGQNGIDGKSAYQLAVDHGFVGDEAAWLQSLKGANGASGTKGEQGERGQNGIDGKSAYQLAVDHGFVGDEAAWLQSLKGANGASGVKGEQGERGQNGINGKSAYQLAVDHGFVGDEAAWLQSLKGANGASGGKGEQGVPGKSAYQIAVDHGFVGDEAAWLRSLKGADGAAGIAGAKGEAGQTAYQLAVARGFKGDEAAWLESLKAATANRKEYEEGYLSREEMPPMSNNTLSTIKFKKPFTERPMVTVMLDIADTSPRLQYVSNITTEGFSIGTNYAGSLNGLWYSAYVLQ